MSKTVKVPLPKGRYYSKIEVKDDGVYLDLEKKKRVALLLIGLNTHYWPYLKQVIEDARVNFLPHHNVDYFIWTDIPESDVDLEKKLSTHPTEEQIGQLREFAKDTDDLMQIQKLISREKLMDVVNFIRDKKDIVVTETDPLEHRYCTLLRYHLFLQQEEKLKDYDYIFYLDVDMRIVSKVSDEVLGEALTCAEHPMYSLAPRFHPPYEPNKDSSAFIPRVGQVISDEKGTRFRPLYLAGGFQGGKPKHFIKAMKVMKKRIDRDLDNNYVAIWNDESHWNRYLFDYTGTLTVLPPAYIYPDSLIKEYYEPIWGRSYEPKIVTITKPFMLSKEAGQQLRDQMGIAQSHQPILLANKIQCEQCGDVMQQPKMHLKRIISCAGKGNAHQLEMTPI